MSSFLLINPDALVLQNYYDVFRVIHQRKIDNKPTFQFDSLITQNVKLVYQGNDANVIALIRNLDPNYIKNGSWASGDAPGLRSAAPGSRP